MATDRRTRKTQAAIKTALITLMQTKPLTKISVIEVAKQADISRSTFYLHYDDVYDLYDQLYHEFLAGLMANFEQHYPKLEDESYAELVFQLLDYVEQNSEMFMLFVNENSVAVIDKLSKLFVNRVIAIEAFDENDDRWYYEIIWSVNGLIGAIVEWLRHDMRPNKAEFSEILRTILDQL